MVKRLLFLFCLLPYFLFSGEFSASVNRYQMDLGESFALSLTLKGVAAKSTPLVEPLKSDFFIDSQQQSSSTMIVNGRMTSSVTWKVNLIPKHEGEIEIPSISIRTADGTLSTKPVIIYVLKETITDSSRSFQTGGLVLNAEVNNPKPYKNEPVIYTIRLISKDELMNIRMQKIQIEDAIVELNGEPKTEQKLIDGAHVEVLELSYLVTPLKAGTLKIPATLIQGGIPLQQRVHRRSFFDDDFDPFSMIRGFDRLKPFALTTQEIVLDVQPSVPGEVPWLPAKSLKIQEVWNPSQTLQVGEPLTRELEIVAEGLKSSQLPSFSEMQLGGDHGFKVYADKPESSEVINGINIVSSRKEVYTLIPQRAGSLTLPEVVIPWWDVQKKEKTFARLPARTLDVLPAPEREGKPSFPQTNEERPVEPPSESSERSLILYVVIGGLGMLFLGALIWGLSLQRKIARLTDTTKKGEKSESRMKTSALSSPRTDPPKQSAKKDKNEKLPDLNPT